jgi:hypothetical protein
MKQECEPLDSDIRKETLFIQQINKYKCISSQSWPSDQHSCFVFERSWIQISAQRPAILIEVFRSFSQSLQANTSTVP